jgi:hypothetical protein
MRSRGDEIVRRDRLSTGIGPFQPFQSFNRFAPFKPSTRSQFN